MNTAIALGENEIGLFIKNSDDLDELITLKNSSLWYDWFVISLVYEGLLCEIQ